jgi:hypothetical protein
MDTTGCGQANADLQSPGGTFKPPACSQDWVVVFYLSSLELPRNEDNKSISGLHGLFLPAEQGFGLGLLDTIIVNLLSWEGRMIVDNQNEKTTTRCTGRHTRPSAAVTLQPDKRQLD